jgi:MFS family permease
MEDSPAGAGRALYVVSLAVLLSSSTWLAGSAAVPALRAEWSLTDSEGAWLTIAVQLGFIAGTLLFAIFNVADLHSARAVFAASALAGSLVNLGFAWASTGLFSALVFRFLTGLTLAGVYPVGMKIVATWFRGGLGRHLGVLVGALTLGTGAPYLIRALGAGTGWRTLSSVASILSALGAALVALLVADGPFTRPPARFDPAAALRLFRDRRFRWNAFGYFGHMWELYAMWSLIAFYLAARLSPEAEPSGPAALGAFFLVAVGALGCVLGGWVSIRVGERRVALVSMLVSGAACALSGLAFRLPLPALAVFLFLWGFFVIADSPQFSALAARYAPPEYVATALTLQNGLGFLVTVASLQVLPLVAAEIGWPWAFTVLAPGPLIGAFYMWRLGR